MMRLFTLIANIHSVFGLIYKDQAEYSNVVYNVYRSIATAYSRMYGVGQVSSTHSIKFFMTAVATSILLSILAIVKIEVPIV